MNVTECTFHTHECNAMNSSSTFYRITDYAFSCALMHFELSVNPSTYLSHRLPP